MKSLEQLKDSVSRHVRRLDGEADFTARLIAKEVTSLPFASEIHSFPAGPSHPLQDLDTGSSTFGEFYFLAGYDPVGGGAPIGP